MHKLPGRSAFTVEAPPDSRMLTGLPVHHVMAVGSVLAGLTGTLVHIQLTVDAIEAGQTLARVRANQVVAGGPVVAGTGLTLIDFHLTVDSWGRRAESTSVSRNNWKQ